jgi:hypothetical protein
MNQFQVKGCKDFGYIIDAFHLLRQPGKPRWVKILDAVLASLVFFGWYGALGYLLVKIILWTHG